MRPTLWIVAGPNGAGKSTLVQAAPINRVLPGVTFWNPDSIARDLLMQRGFHSFADAPLDQQRLAFLEAATFVESKLSESVASCQAAGVETVLSTRKYCKLVDEVVTRGGFFGLIYVSLQSSDLACQRVAQRTREGGHSVPVEKIESRWHKSLANIPWFAERASQFFIFDNSSADRGEPPALVAYGSQGRIRQCPVQAHAALAAVLATLPGYPQTSLP